MRLWYNRKIMKKKKVTIENLASMVQRGFLDIEEKVATKEQVTMGFDRIDQELKAIRKQLGNVVYRFEFEKLEDRVKDLENLLLAGNKKH